MEMKFNRKIGVIKLHQKTYIRRILQRFDMENVLPSTTPMEARLKIKKSGLKNKSTEVRNIIDVFIYCATYKAKYFIPYELFIKK